MRKIFAALALAASMTAISPASAAVTYTFNQGDFGPFSTGFTYTTSNFISGATHVDVSALSVCGGFIASCDSVDFAPNSSGLAGAYDELSLNLLLFGKFPFSDPVDFKQGAFQSVGSYTSLDGRSTLDVSGVPLPASAPMFGAALLALGAVGYGMKRKGSATA